MEYLDPIETFIRNGDTLLVIPMIEKRWQSDRETADAWQWANWARRSGLTTLAQEIIIRTHLKTFGTKKIERAIDFKPTQLNNSLKIEWAATLSNFGSANEALSLLESLSDSRALIVKALAHISLWDYSSAKAELERALIQNLFSNSYEQYVAELNLLACEIVLGLKTQVIRRYQDLLKKIDVQKHKRLRANLMELSIQANALKLLPNETVDLWNNENPHPAPHEKLYIEKWRAVRLAQTGHTIEAVKLFRFTQKSAAKLRHYETLRDCDFQVSKLRKDTLGLKRLYFSSPHPSYKAQILNFAKLEKISGDKITSLPCEAKLHFQTFHKKEISKLPALKIDISNAEVTINHQSKNFYQSLTPKIFKLFAAAFFDLYRPSSLGAISNSIFPDERFVYSVHFPRITQLCFRLNRILKDHKIPLSFTLNANQLIPQSAHPLILQFHKVKSNDPLIEHIKQNFDHEDFHLQELEGLCKMNKRTLQRAVARLQKLGHLKSSGSTWRKRYKLNREY